MRRVVSVGLLLVLVAAACGDDDTANPTPRTTSSTATSTAAAVTTTTTTAPTTTTTTTVATTTALPASLSGDVVYLGDQDAGGVIAVDGATGRTVGIADIGATPDWMAVGHGALWIAIGARTAEARLLRLDPVTLTTVSDLALDGSAFDLTITESGIWTETSPEQAMTSSMIRIAPDGSGIVQEVAIDCGAVPSAGGPAVVHRVSFTCGVLFGWDDAGVLVRVAELPDANNTFLATDAGTVYVPADGGIYRVTPEGDIGFMELGVDVTALAFDGAVLWAISSGTLWHIDGTVSSFVELIPGGGFVWGPAVGRDGVYVVADGSLWRADPDGRAAAIADVPEGVRRLAVASDPVATGEEAVAAPEPDLDRPVADTPVEEAVAALAHFYPDHTLLSRIDRPEEAGVGDVVDLVASSDATPGFRIIVRMRRLAPGVSSAAEGCDLELASGVRWCHSTAPSGLQAWAGPEAMMPASIRVGIEAAFADAHPGVLVVDFRPHSNVEISLAWITEEERVGWDGESFSAESTWDNDIGAGVWRER
ncbi:MAG: hypothetical protein R3290_12740 [Acidimicrobiia bacterium]|nr:hypothetical protein [Acidimicrobiia bacterium]